MKSLRTLLLFLIVFLLLTFITLNVKCVKHFQSTQNGHYTKLLRLGLRSNMGVKTDSGITTVINYFPHLKNGSLD